MNGPGTATADADEGWSAPLLLRRARRLLWITLVPLLLVVLVMAAWQAHAQWRRVLDEALSEARTQRPAFDALARDAAHHVADLRRWMEQEFLRIEGQAPQAIVDALQPHRAANGAADGFTLDDLTEALRPGMAQLLWPQGDGTAPPQAVLRRAAALSAAMEIAHQRHATLARSSFFGWPDRHWVVYPWQPSASLVAETQSATLAEALDRRYAQPLLRQAMPERNVTRQAYWTAPWVDPGGRGLMISHAAPVVAADEVGGVVAVDLRLEMLDELLARLPAGPWQAWVVDAQGHVLADRQRPVRPTDATAPPPRLAERLPAAIDRPLLASAAASAQVEAAGDLRVIAVNLHSVPWTLVLAAPRGALLRSTLPQVLPYSLIVLGLLGVWVAAQVMLRQRVVAPLLQILDYLQRLSVDATAAQPSLSPRWQPWVRVITRTFATMRAAAQGERRAEALKSAIVDHAQAAVVVADASDRIVEFNAAAEAMLGLPRERAIGRSVRDLVCPPRYHAAYDAARARMRGGDPDGLLGRRMERWLLRQDGREFAAEVVMWLTQVDGADYFTASMTDLSEAKASAEVIARQRDALRQSEKLTAMGSLLAGVAHELNNPLAIVMGRASLLEEKTEGTPLHADARRIREAAERCGRIVRTFLNMARSRPAQHAPVQLNDLARAAADMLGYTLRSHGIELELRLATELPEVQADGDQIGQVLLNLIVNAQQALLAQGTPGEPRRIGVRSGEDGSADGSRRVWLRVSDNGPGVPDEVRSRIFEPFFTTKADGIGTGLGLSVSRSIVREHGGELLLEDTPPGQGASFLLRLPLQLAGTAATAAPAESTPEAGAAGARVLVVDDEADLTELLRSMLEGAGYEVATADSGAVALELLDTARFDAIVSDLRMPAGDGAELWRAINQRHPALARRTLFVSGDSLSPGARQFLDDTGCPHLDKPFARHDLIAQVQRLLQPALQHG